MLFDHGVATVMSKVTHMSYVLLVLQCLCFASSVSLCSLKNFIMSGFARDWCRFPLFPFHKQAMPFLMLDPIIGNQGFQNERCHLTNLQVFHIRTCAYAYTHIRVYSIYAYASLVCLS